MRWQHPRRGLLGPGEFIPLAEEAGLIVALGDWVLAAAARYLRQWAEAGLAPVRVSINLASPSFLEEQVAEKCCAIIGQEGIAPEQVVLELTESLLVVDAERTIVRLDSLREQHDVTWHWVKGHAGHAGTERADELANKGVDAVRQGRISA